MNESGQSDLLPASVRARPLQAVKFGAIVLALILGLAGFFRLLDPSVLFDGPAISDGQFLAIVLLPLVSLGLVLVVCVEAVVSVVRILRSSQRLRDQLTDRVGYRLLRVIEAGVAILGVLLMVTAIPVLFAESTPAPAGVGAMLLLFGVGVAILFASLVRSGAELFVWSE